jgi:hypothetical protein
VCVFEEFCYFPCFFSVICEGCPFVALLCLCFPFVFVVFGFLCLLCSCGIYCSLVCFVLFLFISFLLPWLLNRCGHSLLGSLWHIF